MCACDVLEIETVSIKQREGTIEMTVKKKVNKKMNAFNEQHKLGARVKKIVCGY